MAILKLTGFYTGDTVLVNVGRVQTFGTGNEKQTVICFSKDHGDELSVKESLADVEGMLENSVGVKSVGSLWRPAELMGVELDGD